MRKVAILAEPGELADAIALSIRFGLADLEPWVVRFPLENVVSLRRKDILAVDVFVCPAFSPFDPTNPVGFRAAWRLADFKASVVLFNHPIPDGFPTDGPFWMTLYDSATSIADKVRSVMTLGPPCAVDFNDLVARWPLLAHEPSALKPHGNHCLPLE